MGSVKDLVILEAPDASRTGRARFVFSDRYSVFDWGEMPNLIMNKGRALCLLGAYFFEKLEEMGIQTHYLGVVNNSQANVLANTDEPTDIMEVKLLRVLRPEVKGSAYDYSIYKRERANFLIPLEVMFRNSLPAGSSVFQRLRDGVLKPEDIGLDREPIPGEKLRTPLLDVSTKLEATDRYISWEEAQRIAGLGTEELEKIKSVTLTINQLITQEVERIGLYHEDGKVEFGFNENRELLVVDVFGTPDECRFSYEDIPVSKEAARIFYRKTLWYKDIDAAKKKDRQGWKGLVKTPPPTLPEKLHRLLSLLYMGCCNEITKREWFDVPPLKEILSDLKAELNLPASEST